MEGGNLHFLAARLRAKIESLCKPQPLIISTVQEEQSEKEWYPTTATGSSAQTSNDLKIDQLTLQNHALERENGLILNSLLRMIASRRPEVEMRQLLCRCPKAGESEYEIEERTSFEVIGG
jgi:hypothetical protein